MSKLISIYLTPGEAERIDSYLNENNVIKLSKSEFFRTIILKTIDNQKIILEKTCDIKVIVALNRIGININQIAKKANSLNILSEDDISKLDQLIIELRDAMFRY